MEAVDRCCRGLDTRVVVGVCGSGDSGHDWIESAVFVRARIELSICHFGYTHGPLSIEVRAARCERFQGTCRITKALYLLYMAQKRIRSIQVQHIITFGIRRGDRRRLVRSNLIIIIYERTRGYERLYNCYHYSQASS